MSYVFFDLEWNQGYPRSEAEVIDEIIQIGAYRLRNWQDSGDAFSAWVKPSIHRKLHHRMKAIVPLNQGELKRAAGFRKVAADFFHWCGKDARFYTWGPSDARVLDTNLCWYGLEEYLDIEIYDLQRAFDLLVLQTVKQTALETAVNTLGLDSVLEYHDAGNDACYTARIGAELVRRFGPLPEERELDRLEQTLRAKQRQEASRQACGDLDILTQEPPVLSRRGGPFANALEGLKSWSARAFPCPQCGNQLICGNWYQMEQRYISRSRCKEHGKFLNVMTFHAQGHQKLHGELNVFSDEDAPDDLFRLCRQGGEEIVVGRMPRKSERKSRSGKGRHRSGGKRRKREDAAV